jgi:uncharacterized protein YjbI with pentapeptide repeats
MWKFRKSTSVIASIGLLGWTCSSVLPITFLAEEEAHANAVASSPAASLLRDSIYQEDHQVKPGVSLENLSFENQELLGANLRNAKLAFSSWKDMGLYKANFTSSDLTKASFERTSLVEARFNNAKLIGTRFTSVSLVGASFSGSTGTVTFGGPALSLRNADLGQIVIDLGGEGRGFMNADLRGANLSAATIGFGFLEGANFKGAVLRGLKTGNVDWTGAICPSGKTQSTKEPCSEVSSVGQGNGFKTPSESIVPTSTSAEVQRPTPTTVFRQTPSTIGTVVYRQCFALTEGVKKAYPSGYVLKLNDGSTKTCSKVGTWIPSKIGAPTTAPSKSAIRGSSSCVAFSYGFVPRYWANGETAKFQDGTVRKCVNGTWSTSISPGGSGSAEAVVVMQDCVLVESGLSSNWRGQSYRWTFYDIYADGRRKAGRSGWGYADQVPEDCW